MQRTGARHPFSSAGIQIRFLAVRLDGMLGNCQDVFVHRNSEENYYAFLIFCRWI